jgi:septum formation protein
LFPLENISKKKVILASRSPRRQFLLKGLGIDFEVWANNDIDEQFPPQLTREEIPVYLASQKAHIFINKLEDNHLLITADTIVWFEEQVLDKPENFQDAKRILKKLSGNKHVVITGVCIKTLYKEVTFYVSTNVYFSILSEHEIEYYLRKYKPYDKAGAYGIQEWIGYIGIEKIDGSYFNVMGLPVQRLYSELKRF